MDFRHGPVIQIHAIDHRWRGGDQIEIELAGQAFLNDFKMQQPEEAAAETKPQGRRRLRFVMEACIVEPQLGEAFAKILIFGRIDREQAAEHHRHAGLEPG